MNMCKVGIRCGLRTEAFVYLLICMLLEDGNLPEIRRVSSGPSIVGAVGWWEGGLEAELRSELLGCREKVQLGFQRSLESWIGARPHGEVRVLTGVIFIMLKRRSPRSIASRWVSRGDIYTLCARTGKAGMKDGGQVSL